MPPSQTKGFPTPDEVIDYLTRYERRYGFPIERCSEVEAVERNGGRLCLRLRDQHSLTARAVVSATGTWGAPYIPRSEEPTSELQSLMRLSYAVFCLKKKKHIPRRYETIPHT